MFGLAWTSEAENGVLEMSVCAAHAAIAEAPRRQVIPSDRAARFQLLVVLGLFMGHLDTSY
jgi:hypothetical protein